MNRMEFNRKTSESVIMEKNKGELKYLQYPSLCESGVCRHLFSTRLGGVSEGDIGTMNLSYSRGDKKENVDVLLVTSSHYLTNLDIEKFNKQYFNLTIKYSNIFHDRFIIIDNTLYHVGASFKDLGKKCFAINKIEDKEYLDKIINSV